MCCRMNWGRPGPFWHLMGRQPLRDRFFTSIADIRSWECEPRTARNDKWVRDFAFDICDFGFRRSSLSMVIGVPKEIKEQEFRVALLPSAAYQLIKRGHRVIVESN